jgi:hypothetical protein
MRTEDTRFVDGGRWPAILTLSMTASLFSAHRPLPPCARHQYTQRELPSAEVIGIHGTGEGPSTTDGNDSPEIKATFATDEQKLGEYGADLVYYPYPTVTFADFLPTAWPKLYQVVKDYAGEL